MWVTGHIYTSIYVTLAGDSVRILDGGVGVKRVLTLVGNTTIAISAPTLARQRFKAQYNMLARGRCRCSWQPCVTHRQDLPCVYTAQVDNKLLILL